MREKGRGAGRLNTPPGPGGYPDKEAKPAFPDLMASQGNKPDTGRSPMESWKQVLPWYRGKSLGRELEGLGPLPASTCQPRDFRLVLSLPCESSFLLKIKFQVGAGGSCL
jgi:hypothetical protein